MFKQGFRVAHVSTRKSQFSKEVSLPFLSARVQFCALFTYYARVVLSFAFITLIYFPILLSLSFALEGNFSQEAHNKSVHLSSCLASASFQRIITTR